MYVRLKAKMSFSRLQIAEQLYNKGKKSTISPLDPNYRSRVENLLIDKYAKDSDLTKTKELAFRNAAKVKILYKENNRSAEKMLKKDWFLGDVKNPLEKKAKAGPGRPKPKNQGGAPKKDYADKQPRSQFEEAKAHIKHKDKKNEDRSLEELIHTALGQSQGRWIDRLRMGFGRFKK
jgi:hypothetical protein